MIVFGFLHLPVKVSLLPGRVISIAAYLSQKVWQNFRKLLGTGSTGHWPGRLFFRHWPVMTARIIGIELVMVLQSHPRYFLQGYLGTGWFSCDLLPSSLIREPIRISRG